MKVIWDLLPGSIKWPLLILGTPALIVSSYLSWHSNDIHAETNGRFEKLEIRATNLENNYKSIDEKLNILIQKN